MAKFNKKNDLGQKFRINDEIRIMGNVRVIGENVESKVIPINVARKMAEDMELDLVEINNRADIPILKICNYEKMIYELKKAEKKNKQNAKPMKEIQLSANIAKHDLETKANNARKFLEDGSKVKVVLSMRGRELMRREENKKSILEFIVMLEDIATLESEIRDEGNRTIAMLKRKKTVEQSKTNK